MIPMPSLYPSAAHNAPSSGGRLISTDGQSLPFVCCSLDVDAHGGLARVTLRQTFFNESDEPLHATYQMPLPADAAVGAYMFMVGDKRIVGEIEGREAAREQFEEAILEGRSAALLEQDRSSLFTQEIGNIPPHTEVTCELTLDQKLRWLTDGQWEWRFPTVVAPRFMGSKGRVADSKRLTVDVAQQDLFARAALSMAIRDAITVSEPTSSTHHIIVRPSDGLTKVAFVQEEGVALDRDIVVRWTTAAPEVGVSLDTARPSAAMRIADDAYGLLTLTPPPSDQSEANIPRDLIILIDTSGSMSGEPLERAKSVVLDIIASLTPCDRLELIEFSMEPHRWKKHPAIGNEKSKSAASDWVRSLEAGGYTEMRSGLLEALSQLRPDAQRQVLLVTDGLVGFENEIVGLVRQATPMGSRVHSIGIGSASNRSLTGAVARAGGGVEFIVGLEDDVHEAASRIIARTSRPLCIDVKVSGSAVIEAARHSVPDLFGGAPAQIALKLRPTGGELLIQGRTAEGSWMQRLEVDACETGTGSESIPRLFAREKVEELELDAATGEDVDEAIEQIGLGFGISTRMTSWVAISEEPTVDPCDPVRRVRVPQLLPSGMSTEGLGLREANSTIVEHVVQGAGRAYLRSIYQENFEDSGGAVDEWRTVEDRSNDEDEFKPELSEHHFSDDVLFEDFLYLIGEVVSLRDGRLVIEIELKEELEWRPQSVLIEQAEQAKIDIAATTRSGVYSPGQRIRLVLTDLPPNSMQIDIRQIEVHMDRNARLVKLGLSDS